jgi:flagellar basal-body rod protein FlgB
VQELRGVRYVAKQTSSEILVTAYGTRFDLEGRAMFVNKWLNQDNAPVLEQMLQFTSARHKLLAENIANLDTPGYKQKDLSVASFQAAIQERIKARESRAPENVSFDGTIGDVIEPNDGMLSHDGNNRSAEQLMSEFAKNAMMHNMAVEMLRKQYSMLEMALKERVS